MAHLPPRVGRTDPRASNLADSIMSGGFQVDMDALERVGRGYQLAAGQLREVLGGLDAQVGALGDAMGIGGATAAYERMWSAWRGALGGLCTELDAQVSRLLHAVASYDAADNQDAFTGVRNRVKGHGP